jgi:hypothetical protein
VRKVFKFAVLVTCLIFGDQEADARGRLGSFIGRGIAHGGARAAGSAMTQKTYGPDVLTIGELSGCLKSASALDARDDEIEKNGAAVDALKKQVEESDRVLRNAEISVDTRSQYSVDRFNELVRRHNALVAEGKVLVAAFNASVSSHNQNVTAYNFRCGKKYYESDLATAKQIAGIP